jgi:hypothetical protein
MSQKTLARPLNPLEVAVFRKSMDEFRAYLGPKPETAEEILAVGDTPVDGSLGAIELAVWTLVASQYLNLDEFLTK